ncbi:MAG: HD domain-containing protein [Lachnospiraceae bacterium]|nr:HD domain-containing protein [Lachnospiraceae bacterium]
MKDRIVADVNSIGREILESKEFARALEQTHHDKTTVGNHSIEVACIALKLSRRLKAFHIPVNEEAVVRGALCHDLGILGRDDKYPNNFICLHRHPKDSLVAADELLGGLTEMEKDIIANHMFPLTFIPPHHKEAVLVSCADKISSIREVVRSAEKNNKEAMRKMHTA